MAAVTVDLDPVPVNLDPRQFFIFGGDGARKIDVILVLVAFIVAIVDVVVIVAVVDVVVDVLVVVVGSGSNRGRGNGLSRRNELARGDKRSTNGLWENRRGGGKAEKADKAEENGGVLHVRRWSVKT